MSLRPAPMCAEPEIPSNFLRPRDWILLATFHEYRRRPAESTYSPRVFLSRRLKYRCSRTGTDRRGLRVEDFLYQLAQFNFPPDGIPHWLSIRGIPVRETDFSISIQPE